VRSILRSAAEKTFTENLHIQHGRQHRNKITQINNQKLNKGSGGSMKKKYFWGGGLAPHHLGGNNS